MKGKILLFLIVSVVFKINAQNILLNYPFSGNANDESGNGIHGITHGGVTLTEDRFGNPNSAYYFDGVDDYISIPHDTIYKVSLPVTLSLWAKFDDSSLVSQIFKTDNHTTTYYGINLNSNGEYLSTSVMNGLGAGSQYRYTAFSSNKYMSDLWHHIVVVYNSVTSMDIYVDGVLQPVTNNGTGSTLAYSTSDGSIGMSFNQFGGASTFFSGKIDDVMLIEGAISQSDIYDLQTSQSDGCFGSYMTFDATDDHVKVDSIFPGVDSTFTFEAKFLSLGNGLGLYSRLIGWDSYRMLIAQYTNGVIYTYDNAWRVTTSGDIRDSNWHHIAVVMDNNQQRVYLDGRNILTQIYGGTKVVNFNGSSMWIGSENGPGNENWNGYIDEVRIWDDARTWREIKENMYTPLTGSEPNLVAYFDFEQDIKSDKQITDMSLMNIYAERGGNTGVNVQGPKFINECEVSIVKTICDGQTYTTPSGKVINTIGNYVDTVNNNLMYETYAITLNNDNCNSTSIEKVINNEVRIFPNPTDKILNIEVAKFEKANYFIYNMIGEIVKIGNINNEITKIDLSNNNTGIYLLKLNVDGELSTTKITVK